MLDITCIVLSSFNGAAFLGDQLNSLLAQSDRRWCLLWRDDGSDDNSAEMIEKFADRIGSDRVRRLLDPCGKLGAAKSFFELLRAVPGNVARIAFCDQDDVWLPDKLARASAAISGYSDSEPVLYCARQVIVDQDLRWLGYSPLAHGQQGLNNALVQNIAVGNTLVLNAAGLKRIILTPPPRFVMHDWWAYLVVSATGGRVIFDPSPVVLYRQHDSNFAGARVSVIKRIFGALERGPTRFLETMAINIAAISAHPMLTPEARHLLDAVYDLSSIRFLERFQAFRRSGLTRQTLLDNLLLAVLLTLRALPVRPLHSESLR